MTSIRWLHLTDLHVGMRDQDRLWPTMRERFFRDLPRLHDRCGPWDLVLFTGDLTYRASREEFQEVNQLLEQLWNRLRELGSEPKLLAVPGNHDLVRPQRRDDNPDYYEVVENLTQDWNRRREGFWNEPQSRCRQVVDDAFANYVEWWQNQRCRPEGVREGILPGDFSYTFRKGDAKIGILGLNTSFLQLTSDVKQGQLALDILQFHRACRSSHTDGPAWSKQHHACLLLTHHPLFG